MLPVFHLGPFNDWREEAMRQRALFPVAYPGPTNPAGSDGRLGGVTPPLRIRPFRWTSGRGDPALQIRPVQMDGLGGSPRPYAFGP